VRQIYDSAEHLYTPKPLSGPSIVLLRACAGEANDTPYREIYADQMFGWGSLTKSLTIVDVDGGHSSMLQEPFVESLADALRTHLIHDSQSSCASFINGSDVEKSVPFADAQRQFADAQPENAA
jgi:thioesterase domain-containing protein